MLKSRLWTALVLGLLVLAMIGCTQAQKGAIMGGGGGAALGGIIGGKEGAIIGGAVGGAAGAIIGDYMDKQAAEMEQEVDGAEITREGEHIQVTFDSGILFQVNKADLTTEAQANLIKMSEVLTKYGETDIAIEGHTDSDGSDEYNQTLSEKRAQSVFVYLSAKGVTASRMNTTGYGEASPVADNASPEGKQQNRRVEVFITANEDLKAQAEEQAKQG